MPRKKKEEEDVFIDIGDTVYLRTDPEHLPRIVVSFKYHPSGMPKYTLALGDKKSKHFPFEIEREIQRRTSVTGFNFQQKHVPKKRT